MGKFDSAYDLARQFAAEQARGSIFDADSLMAPMLHVQRPRCWICKKWVREMDEEVSPGGDHKLTVRCCGKEQIMVLRYDDLANMHKSGVGIEMGWAFQPAGEIEGEIRKQISDACKIDPKLISEDSGTAVRIQLNQEKEKPKDHA